MKRLSTELKIAIGFARLELLEIEAGKRELTQCPGLKRVAAEIMEMEALGREPRRKKEQR